MKSPYPFFGGKSRIASQIWAAFGPVKNFIDPFMGSNSVYLSSPYHGQMVATVNDSDGYIANFWRAAQAAPYEVAKWADWPVNEADLHARHLWLRKQTWLYDALLADPDFYDAKIAGYWLWGKCMWIGDGFCTTDWKQKPYLASQGVGINIKIPRKMPNLGDKGRGINRVTPLSRKEYIVSIMEGLQAIMRDTRVLCGDWSRCTGYSATTKLGVTGVILDPPYGQDIYNPYSTERNQKTSVSVDARNWAIENGDNPLFRIALCGYMEEHDDAVPADWQRLQWKANGGYSNTAKSDTGRRDNRKRECIWFSPHCNELPA